MGTTNDANDPRLSRGIDTEPVGQAEVYLVLSDEEIAKGFVRPLRHSYWHVMCGKITTMATSIAETYARDPKFYGATYCAHCKKHRSVGVYGEFYWCDDDNIERQNAQQQDKVGT